MINYFRIISLIFLLIVIIVDIPFYPFLKDSNFQFIIALFILIILLAFDIGVGFILGVAMLIIYYKSYSHFLNKIMTNNKKKEKENNKESNKDEINNVYKLAYISPEHLIAAQNNIFDIKSYKNEVKGFDHGYNNEKVYGAQGLDTENINLVGYDKNSIIDYNLNDFYNKQI